MPIIFIDADACPVKTETYKVAHRYKFKVWVVANSYFQIPEDNLIEMKVVTGDFDAADDWIVDNINLNDIVITSDILLADRCIKKNAKALGPKGHQFTDDNIGSAVAHRDLMQNLRHMGEKTGGPAALSKQDRSHFLATLDQIIQKILNSLK